MTLNYDRRLVLDCLNQLAKKGLNRKVGWLEVIGFAGPPLHTWHRRMGDGLGSIAVLSIQVNIPLPISFCRDLATLL